MAAALSVRDLGPMPYARAFALQKDLQRRVIEGRGGAGSPMHLLLVEHDPPVITVSRRRGVRGHVIATAEQLHAAGVEVVETDRGGDVTFHGPGQLVAYPILDLNVLGLRVHSYMRFLERVVIDVLAGFGLRGVRDEAATGVWVNGGSPGAGDGPPEAARKICAMGVRVSRWVSMHGLALNVSVNLDDFDLIVPCGLTGRAVTSMQRELAGACPSMAEVKRAMALAFNAAVDGARRTAGARSALTRPPATAPPARRR